ncbi:inositol monophosphatase family protein [Oceanobacillus alkalisoli]|uniref:inositol monophosphatase family protein n=2 Tax=Oceanobacillus alkalisoli TaxID=2925113 RepID=UPI0028731D38|nr:inositol monophosphatase family protein [Oceanobacillus alkalisoli]
MDKMERNQVYLNAEAWVLEAGEQIRNKINEPRIIETKSNPNDLVTEMDKQTEKFLVEKIKETYPEHYIIGEEGYGDELTSLQGTVWIIDPIDGTMNFVHQRKNFAISVAVFHDEIGEIGLVYDVMADELYHAKRSEGAYKNEELLPELRRDLKLEESIVDMNHYFLCPNRVVDEKIMHQMIRTVRGSRSYGSAALEFAYVAEGIIDGYLSMRLAPWDIAAGIVLVNEVGGVSTTLDGVSLNMLTNNSILTCNPKIQEQLLAFIKNGRKRLGHN